jgi:hypothetical protein
VQQRAQVVTLDGEQAGEQLAVSRQPGARAAAAERPRHPYVEAIVTRGLAPRGVRDPRQYKAQFYAYAVPYVWISKPDQQTVGTDLVIARDTIRIPTASVDPTVKNFHWGDLTRGMFESFDRGAMTVVLPDGNGGVATAMQDCPLTPAPVTARDDRFRPRAATGSAVYCRSRMLATQARAARRCALWRVRMAAGITPVEAVAGFAATTSPASWRRVSIVDVSRV